MMVKRYCLLSKLTLNIVYKIFRFFNSKKYFAQASTSAEALCIPSNSYLKRIICNSC